MTVPRASLNARKSVNPGLEDLSEASRDADPSCARTYFGRVSSKGLENVSRFLHLFAELVRPGFYEHDIAKITSGNMRCVLRRVEAIGGQLRKARGVIV